MMCCLDDATLCALLNDDVLGGDLTTHSLGVGAQPAQLVFQARPDMTLCASEEAKRLFELAGCDVTECLTSGTVLAPGATFLKVNGTAAQLHVAWKTAQNLVEWASGIATAMAAIVAAAPGVAVAGTRKNVPFTKTLSIKAVKAGGGIMHRLGLSETLLLFAEHRLFLDETPRHTIQRLHRAQPEKKIVVEVATVDEAVLWAGAGAEVLQLEKFTLDAVAACRKALDATDVRRPLLAAAGGIRADNAAAYVRAGADFLVTSAPYSAAPKDVQVRFFKR